MLPYTERQIKDLAISINSVYYREIAVALTKFFEENPAETLKNLQLENDQLKLENEKLKNPIDWNDVSKDYDWIAQNKDGSWIAFECKPITDYKGWTAKSGDHCYYPIVVNPNWKDTLQRRPKSIQLEESDVIVGECYQNRYSEQVAKVLDFGLFVDSITVCCKFIETNSINVVLMKDFLNNFTQVSK